MPSNAPPARNIALVVLALAVVVVGVVVLGPGATGDNGETGVEPIGQNASERLESLDGYAATVETTVVRGNETNRTVRRISARPGTGEFRSEPVDGNGSVFVSNGSVTWLYDPEAGEVTRFEGNGAGMGTATSGERVERLFTRLNISREAVDEPETAPVSPGFVPFPVVPSGAGVERVPPEVNRSGFGVQYNGTASVDGRETYVLTLGTPNSSGGGEAGLGNYTQRLYVDTEWFIPLRTEVAFSFDGQRVETTSVYRNVTFEPELAESLFEFDPPAGVTVTARTGPEVRSYESLAALRANSSLPVPDPEVPSSFSLETAQAVNGSFQSMNGSFQSVTLQYGNATSSLTVSKSTSVTATGATNDTAGNVTGSDGERVPIDGEEGVYRRFTTTRIVSWSCGDVQYTVSGDGVSRELVVEVAESVGCPA